MRRASNVARRGVEVCRPLVRAIEHAALDLDPQALERGDIRVVLVARVYHVVPCPRPMRIGRQRDACRRGDVRRNIAAERNQRIGPVMRGGAIRHADALREARGTRAATGWSIRGCTASTTEPTYRMFVRDRPAHGPASSSSWRRRDRPCDRSGAAPARRRAATVRGQGSAAATRMCRSAFCRTVEADDASGTDPGVPGTCTR